MYRARVYRDAGDPWAGIVHNVAMVYVQFAGPGDIETPPGDSSEYVFDILIEKCNASHPEFNQAPTTTTP